MSLKTILVVDDEPANLAIMDGILAASFGAQFGFERLQSFRSVLPAFSWLSLVPINGNPS